MTSCGELVATSLDIQAESTVDGCGLLKNDTVNLNDVNLLSNALLGQHWYSELSALNMWSASVIECIRGSDENH